MAALTRTNSTFVAPAPRAIGAPNMSLEHDHRQKHPGSLYSDENHTHFNTPNGVVEVPRPLLLGSDDWKIAQFAQKKTEAESEGNPLTASQKKRIRAAINKVAEAANDKRLAEEKHAKETAEAEILRKQIRKDKKKARMKEAKQNKTEEKQAALHQEAIQLVEQCEKLGIELLISPSATDEYAIEMCQDAILKYMKTPLTEKERKAREDAFAKQEENIYADVRAKEIFLDGKTNLVAANQMVEGEQFQLPLKKKKKNKNKPSSKSQVPASEPEVNIDWGEDVKMGTPLTKKQRSRIAYQNLAANSAWRSNNHSRQKNDGWGEKELYREDEGRGRKKHEEGFFCFTYLKLISLFMLFIPTKWMKSNISLMLTIAISKNKKY